MSQTVGRNKFGPKNIGLSVFRNQPPESGVGDIGERRQAKKRLRQFRPKSSIHNLVAVKRVQFSPSQGADQAGRGQLVFGLESADGGEGAVAEDAGQWTINQIFGPRWIQIFQLQSALEQQNLAARRGGL